MPFLTPLRATKIGTFAGAVRYVLDEPLRYQLPGSPFVVEVPAGYVTDFVSAPHGFKWLFQDGGPWDAPAVVHDWLCDQEPFSQATADGIFRAALKEAGVPWWRRVLAYHAVRAYQTGKGRGD